MSNIKNFMCGLKKRNAEMIQKAINENVDVNSFNREIQQKVYDYVYEFISNIQNEDLKSDNEIEYVSPKLDTLKSDNENDDESDNESDEEEKGYKQPKVTDERNCECCKTKQKYETNDPILALGIKAGNYDEDDDEDYKQFLKDEKAERKKWDADYEKEIEYNIKTKKWIPPEDIATKKGYVECGLCGKEYAKGHKTNHIKTKFHLGCADRYFKQ